MNHPPTDRSTAKVIIEGHPDIVEALTEVVRQVTIVTYQSKDQHIESTAHVRRSLRVKPIAAGENQ